MSISIHIKTASINLNKKSNLIFMSMIIEKYFIISIQVKRNLLKANIIKTLEYENFQVIRK